MVCWYAKVAYGAVLILHGSELSSGDPLLADLDWFPHSGTVPKNRLSRSVGHANASATVREYCGGLRSKYFAAEIAVLVSM